MAIIFFTAKPLIIEEALINSLAKIFFSRGLTRLSRTAKVQTRSQEGERHACRSQNNFFPVKELAVFSVGVLGG
jgi:hypothetical protein